MQIDGNTKIVALLGHPVEHTLSPLIHNTAFDAQGLNYRYAAFSVRPEDLPAALEGLTTLGFLGANVTIPHKQAVLSLVDEVSPQAQAVGAANTIAFRSAEGTRILHAENTDVHGFLTPLAPYVEDVRKRPVIIFGSGGAARAIVYGIATVVRPPSLVIVARSVERAHRLREEVIPDVSGMPDVQVVSPENAGPYLHESGLMVNCTPLGMSPHENSSPWEDESYFRDDQVVYDLVYNPLETRFLRTAASRGARCINGLEMLIQQASASYRLWTGRQMPVDAVRTALLEHPL